MKVDLGGFVSVEEREQLIEKLLVAKDSIVVVEKWGQRKVGSEHSFL